MKNLHAQKGALLLPVIILMALMASLAASTFFYVLHTVQLQNSEVLSIRDRAMVKHALLNKLAENINSLPDSFSCLESDAADAGAAYRACMISSVQSNHLSNPTIFDFDLLTQPEDNCPNLIDAPNERTGLGFLLSRRASLWPETCVFQSATESPSLRLRANIESAPPILITKASEPGYRIIISAGYIDLIGDVICSNDLIIIAGGDLRIGKIRNPTNKPIRISLISATGALLLGALEGPVLLNAKSHLGNYLPSSIDLHNHGLWPKTIDLMPLSLMQIMPKPLIN